MGNICSFSYLEVCVVGAEGFFDAVRHFEPPDQQDELEHDEEGEVDVDARVLLGADEDLGAHQRHAEVRVHGHRHHLRDERFILLFRHPEAFQHCMP